MSRTTMTEAAVVAVILETWREAYPETLKGIPEQAVMSAARSRAKLAEMEMETVMEGGMLETREQAWGSVAPMFLDHPPVF